MCGRFSPRQRVEAYEDVLEAFDLPLPDQGSFDWDQPEICPTQAYPVIRRADIGYTFEIMRWGLVPFWFPEPAGLWTASTSNARIEEIQDKPSFRGVFARNHCLIPVAWFWEWFSTPDHPEIRKRYEIHRADNFSTVFAGIWDHHIDPSGRTTNSFTILTRAPGPDLSPVHEREPITLKPFEFKDWIDCWPVESIDQVKGIWPSTPAGTFTFAPSRYETPTKPKAESTGTKKKADPTQQLDLFG